MQMLVEEDAIDGYVTISINHINARDKKNCKILKYCTDILCEILHTTWCKKKKIENPER